MTKEKKKLGLNNMRLNPGSPEDAEKFSEIVYRRGGTRRGPRGVMYTDKGVNSKEELKYFLDRGWYSTINEACFGSPESEAELLERENAKLQEKLDKRESAKNAKARNEALKKKLEEADKEPQEDPVEPAKKKPGPKPKQPVQA